MTLGTPHRVRPHARWVEHAGQRATRFLDRSSPGRLVRAHDPLCHRRVDRGRAQSRGPGSGSEATPEPVLTDFVGPSSHVGGDGIVTDDLTRLDGARHVTLRDALHGTYGGPWYGDGHVADRWWPIALEEWRLALEARAERSARDDAA